MRYQQGIWTEGPGVQPTVWQDPKLPAMRTTKFTPPATGASRDYGHTPRYVDTTHGRWSQGEKFWSQQKISSYMKKSRAQQRAQSAQQLAQQTAQASQQTADMTRMVQEGYAGGNPYEQAVAEAMGPRGSGIPTPPAGTGFKAGQALPAEYTAKWYEQSNEPLTPPTAGQQGSAVPEMPPTVARTAPAPALTAAQEQWESLAPKVEGAPLTNPALSAEQQRRRRMSGGL